MAFPLNDQVYTKSFTPREYQVELFYAAKEKNIIVCLGKNFEQTFIVIKLIQEFATNNRRLSSQGGKRSVYLVPDVDNCLIKATYIQQLTDLKVLVCGACTSTEFKEQFETHHVLITTPEICAQLLREERISPCRINLVIVEKCHKFVRDPELKTILQTFLSCENVPRIIGLAVPLFNLTQESGRLGLEIEKVEAAFHCQIETASDILSILRYSPKPKEYVVEYSKGERDELHYILKNSVLHAIEFLRDHRYDPTEIYTEEFMEDIEKIPDPTEKPYEMMQDFLHILETLGPWCADRAALALLILIEKLKIKTPYERHYLLLNMVSSVLMKIRALCDDAFQSLSEKERIYKYATPKVHRLLQILKTFAPFYSKSGNASAHNVNNDRHSQNKSKMHANKKRKDAKDNYYPQAKRSSEEICKKPSKFQRYMRGATDPEFLCGVIFVDKAFVAKVLFYLLNEISLHEQELHFLSPLYTIERSSYDVSYTRDLEAEHRKQEEVLKRFRIHECNLLVATSILEEGIDIPKCNFVMRYDFPKTYQSYVQCKSRARAMDALHVILVQQDVAKTCVWQLARYHHIEKVLLEKCSNKEPTEEEENEADIYAPMIPHYKPLDGTDAPKVTFNSAISLVNRYCAKLPSDTFTRLTPEWSIESANVDGVPMYTCSLRLPINSPVKYVVKSYPMPNRAMARRMAALQLCVALHKENEIDDNLLPIGKENFKAKPEDAEVPALPDESRVDFSEARPGTTKRRQYYYKKTAEALTDCRPIVGVPSYLYHINMVLSCPLPEEQNTRGRRIYPPEESAIGFGIITLKEIPKICPFPIYTRSGEVRVKLKLSKRTVVLNQVEIERVATFLNYTFTNVLRLQQYLMLFDPNASENSYMIVPVKIVATDGGAADVNVDWEFLECIYNNRSAVPIKVPEEGRKEYKFDASKYHDAVIMPWYRSQDQPQYFYVAEICTNLNPKSSFPGDDYSTFEEYYLKKYNIQIQNLDQPLLDVDHTSARLNFLTPRYVNRKGVALPTSSEETKRAKRENLEQKQILVAELCAIHPFPASLWRQAVCLPCILYRINALLLANQIRCQVARMINLGQEYLDADFEWPALDFGWSLAEVLKKSKETEKAKETKIQSSSNERASIIEEVLDLEDEEEEEEEEWSTSEKKLEIGTWSNDMAIDSMDFGLGPEANSDLRASRALDSSWKKDVRYGSPACESDFDGYDSDESDYSEAFAETSEESEDDGTKGLRISYMGENVAEAVENERQLSRQVVRKEFLDFLEMERNSDDNFWPGSDDSKDSEPKRLDVEAAIRKHREAHYKFAKIKEDDIMRSGCFVPCDAGLSIDRKLSSFLSGQGVEAATPPAPLRDAEHKSHVQETVERFTREFVDNQGRRRISGTRTTEKQEEGEAKRAEEELPPVYRYDATLFSFDHQPELKNHPGPSPSLILQALTMSNANDGINLERLETIGDSFLKYAITTYLYCTYENIHEGKLSHLRSKQVSNLNLYRLGRQKMLGESMIATKFEPHDNWLPPCYYVPKELEQALIESGIPSTLWNQADIPTLQAVDPTEITQLVRETEEKLGIMKSELDRNESTLSNNLENLRCFIPYNLITQHSIPDKSIADCVEALIGAYLIACGPRGALLFMAWLGIRVLPTREVSLPEEQPPDGRRQTPAGTTPYEKKHIGSTQTWTQTRYGKLEEPRNPLLRHIPDPEEELRVMLDGYDELERSIRYKFRDISYLLQAFTHASYQPNKLTDCYQRLEFLGDAVLDYLITRHLYEDSRQHSPGALTDLRSALVNNTIFASLAVRCGFHKYFRHLSPGLSVVINRFVRIQEENGHSISEEYYLIGEEECEEAEDVEVPKALGDVFESLAGAIYLDSDMSLDAVWGVYYSIMKSEIEQFSTNVPKSPIRELLELEPETAKFGKPEKLADGRRVRVTVDVFGKGSFKGIGRNYRIAKCTAAKCALKKLKRMQSYPRDKL